uniref:(northern house mosquito) hypothetical protein n=1 Tax=Culex pipiens TaxID=7175 RepID=A0A8D8B435_CULPI
MLHIIQCTRMCVFVCFFRPNVFFLLLLLHLYSDTPLWFNNRVFKKIHPPSHPLRLYYLLSCPTCVAFRIIKSVFCASLRGLHLPTSFNFLSPFPQSRTFIEFC